MLPGYFYSSVKQNRGFRDSVLWGYKEGCFYSEVIVADGFSEVFRRKEVSLEY